MFCSELKDLALSGVKWEIMDIPLIQREQWKKTNTELKNIKNVGTSSSIVPTIQPSNTLSQDITKTMASRPVNIDSLLRMITELNHPLRNSATNIVLPHIATNPNGVIVITDIPGSDDDATGNILSGSVGELFDKMINAIGISRENISIIPLLFWRTPGGRTPTKIELDIVRPFIDRILEFLSPKIILTLGALPASEMFNISLGTAHGKITKTEQGTTIVPIYHPNYLMLKPSAKKDVWETLQEMQKLLKNG